METKKLLWRRIVGMNSLKREKKRRMMAIVLSLVMTISSVILPTEQVHAITQNEVVEKFVWCVYRTLSRGGKL